MHPRIHRPWLTRPTGDRGLELLNNYRVREMTCVVDVYTEEYSLLDSEPDRFPKGSQEVREGHQRK